MTSLVIENGLIVTMDKQRRIIRRGTVAVEDGEIIGVEKTSEAKGKYRAEKVIDGTGEIVMPGFFVLIISILPLLEEWPFRASQQRISWRYWRSSGGSLITSSPGRIFIIAP